MSSLLDLINPGGGAGATNLADLLDVLLTGLTTGDYLQFTGTEWENTSTPPGSGVGGAGVANQVAYWTAISTLGGDAEFIYDDVNNRLRLGASSADKGALGLPTGLTGGIFFDTGTLNKPGFFMTYDATLGSIYKYSANSGQTSDASKIHFQLGEVSSSGPRSWMLSSEGTGQGNVEVEGHIVLHKLDGFRSVAGIGNVDATTVLQTVEGQFLGWWRPGQSVPLRKFGVTTSDEWSFHRNVNHSTGPNHVFFTSEPASGVALEYIFTNPGTGVGSVKTEGYVTISNSNGFSRSVATTGDLRLPNSGTIYAHSTINPNKQLVGIDDATARLTLGGNTKWPASNSAGVLTNDGLGNLSWV